MDHVLITEILPKVEDKYRKIERPSGVHQVLVPCLSRREIRPKNMWLLVIPLALIQHQLRLKSNANEWRRRSVGRIGLLPFSIADVLLPGESLQCHLYEAEQLHLIDCAQRLHNGCVGQLLQSHNSHKVCATAPLLELRELRRLDVGVWCRFTAVGALHVRDVNVAAHVTSARVLTADADVRREARVCNDDEHLSGEVSSLHQEVSRLRQRELEAQKVLGWMPMTRAADDHVRLGHRLEKEVDPYASLEKICAEREEVLRERHMDEAPAVDLGHLHGLWGTPDEASTRRRLLSFTACATLDERWRVRALEVEDTRSRLELARCGLQAKIARLREQNPGGNAHGLKP